ncbi:MAG: hypothetical protein KIT60_04585 [Burkholderiaceae bacterium]|nr:hypothetical protein [Burkholderiaceae bacterium]
MHLGLQDKVGIVTGSGRGIGAETAQPDGVRRLPHYESIEDNALSRTPLRRTAPA